MKARLKATDELWFEVDGETEEELFKQISRVQEVFQHQACGACGSTHVKFVCRLDSSDNDWIEIVCQSCRAKLIFGRTKKDQSLFPRRKDVDGNWLDNGGWTKYDPNAPQVKSTPKPESKSAEVPF